MVQTLIAIYAGNVLDTACGSWILLQLIDSFSKDFLFHDVKCSDLCLLIFACRLSSILMKKIQIYLLVENILEGCS